MNEVPDENDLVYDQYGLDIVGLIRYLYEKLLGGNWESIIDLLGLLWNIYSIIAIILSLLFFVGFIYAKIRYEEWNSMEQNALREEERKWELRYGDAVPAGGKWATIQNHLKDNNPNSWKIAIIEADIYLDEVLTNAGYTGSTIGEKLKSANPTSFTTVQDAWNAHKIRNAVAHVGGDFILTRRIAQEALTQYERVFREFGAI